MTTFEPNEDRILIKPVIEEKAGSIFLPETAKDKPTRGVVVAIGDDPVIKFKPGDKILFGKFAGTIITIDKEDYKILRNKDIFGSVSNW